MSLLCTTTYGEHNMTPEQKRNIGAAIGLLAIILIGNLGGLWLAGAL